MKLEVIHFGLRGYSFTSQTYRETYISQLIVKWFVNWNKMYKYQKVNKQTKKLLFEILTLLQNSYWYVFFIVKRNHIYWFIYIFCFFLCLWSIYSLKNSACPYQYLRCWQCFWVYIQFFISCTLCYLPHDVSVSFDIMLQCVLADLVHFSLEILEKNLNLPFF